MKILFLKKSPLSVNRQQRRCQTSHNSNSVSILVDILAIYRQLAFEYLLERNKRLGS